MNNDKTPAVDTSAEQKNKGGERRDNNRGRDRRNNDGQRRDRADKENRAKSSAEQNLSTFQFEREEGSAAETLPSAERLKVGITHGDFNGIGYEVILRMLEDPRIIDIFIPVVYGSARIAQYYRKALDLQTPAFHQIQDASQLREDACNIVNVIGQESHIAPGEESREAGEAAYAALERAVADLKEGKIDVLVTAPINKHNIQSEEFNFPGHTEYLEAQAGDDSKSLMILASDRLRVALVTTHLPVSRVAEGVTKENILEKLRLFNASLTKDFSIVKPRIAVLSLNPHAGDNGLLGEEEKEIIIPAIEEARKEKIHAFGPYAADGFFGNGLYDRFDGVLAMYHDQGLTPFKTIAMESGVNFTAGLPFVRTSPDHGTGYDIAGKGVALADSMRSAVYMAIDVFRSRKRFEEMTANPLRKQYHEKGRDNVVLDLS